MKKKYIEITKVLQQVRDRARNLEKAKNEAEGSDDFKKALRLSEAELQMSILHQNLMDYVEEVGIEVQAFEEHGALELGNYNLRQRMKDLEESNRRLMQKQRDTHHTNTVLNVESQKNILDRANARLQDQLTDISKMLLDIKGIESDYEGQLLWYEARSVVLEMRSEKQHIEKREKKTIEIGLESMSELVLIHFGIEPEAGGGAKLWNQALEALREAIPEDQRP